MIRRIKKADAPAVRDICADALGHTATAALIEQRIGELADDPAYFIAVLEDDADGRVKGFIQAQTYDLLYGERGWNIIALAVSPDAQKQGFGRALLEALEAHAAANSGSFVRLNSRVERADAHAFYLHLGYVCDKTQKRFIKTLAAK